MSSPSTRSSQNAIAKMYPTPKFTSSTVVISHWTRPLMRLLHYCRASSVLLARRRGVAYPRWSWANGIEVDESGWRIDSDSRELAEKEVDFCLTLIAPVNG